jgi:hypothetical protein
VNLVGFIIKKFVTMHGHMNAKKQCAATESRIPLFDRFALGILTILTGVSQFLFLALGFLIYDIF